MHNQHYYSVEAFVYAALPSVTYLVGSRGLRRSAAFYAGAVAGNFLNNVFRPFYG